MKNMFFRLGVTISLTEEEFELVCTESQAAHDIIRGKIERDEFKLDGESYSPANERPTQNEFYHRYDIELEF